MTSNLRKLLNGGSSHAVPFCAASERGAVLLAFYYSFLTTRPLSYLSIDL